MLSFVDRKKNIIRRSGENIAAAEVEEALIEDSKIKSVAVLAAKDEFHDEEIHACIVLMPNSDASELTAKSIFDFGRSRLITYKLPGWISFVDKIPVTGTQKIRKDAIFPKDFNLKQDVNSFDMRGFKRKKVVKNE
jgi:crotonobetaine/carnitine-CoA ligase